MKVVKSIELVKPKNLVKTEKNKCVIVEIVREVFKNANFNDLATNHDFIIYICNLIENIYKKKVFKKDIKVNKKELAIKALETLIGRNYSAQEKDFLNNFIDTICNSKVIQKVKFSKVCIKNLLSLVNSFL